LAFSAAFFFNREVLRWQDATPLLILLVAAIGFALSLAGRVRAYAVTRGFSSATLWGHTLLVGMATLALAVTPPALIIWTGLRSNYQAYGNPLYPLMAPVEKHLPLVWFAEGTLLMAAALFAVVRAGQPTGSRAAGPLVFMTLVIFLIAVPASFPWLSGWRLGIATIPLAVLGVGFLISSRSLHRSMEVP
jgi:hypothetical protein